MSTVTSVAVPLFEDEQVPMVWPGSPDARLTDPITSHMAADSITAEGRLDSQEHVYLDLLGHGRSTAWQIEARTGGRWSPSRIRTALAELVKQGRAVQFTATGVTPRGRKCNQFEAVSS